MKDGDESFIVLALLLWGAGILGGVVLLIGAAFMRSGLQGLLALLGSAVGFLAAMANFSYTRGRPLRRGLKVLLPEVAEGCGRSFMMAPSLDGLSPEARRALAEEWLADARMEHASVPSFAQMSMTLTALAAPPELVVGAHRAALEEVDHAQRCFALAAAYSGTPLTAGPLPELLHPTFGETADKALLRLTGEALRDGILLEGFAARVAAECARVTKDATVKATLEVMARDEASHAAFSLDVLEWCLARGGSALAVKLREFLAHLPTPISTARWVPGTAVAMEAHGRMSPSRQAVLFADIRGEVIRVVNELVDARLRKAA